MLQFLSALRSILASFSTLYLLIYCLQCNRNGFPNTLVVLLSVEVGCCFLQKALKTHSTLHAEHQAADTVGDELVRGFVFPRVDGNQHGAQRSMNVELTFVKWLKHGFKLC